VQYLSYYTNAQMVGSFIDRVSKGGNLLLNIAPLADGTIPTEQQAILTAFGTFLKQMGTAIYNTRAWTVYGEGPTRMGGGSFTNPTALTSSDIRYTASKDGDAVYAILGGWPGNGTVVNMTAVTTSRFTVGTGKVHLFGPVGGSPIELQFTQDASGLHVTMPSSQPYTNIAYAIKISKSGAVPAPTPCVNNTPCSGTGGTSGTGGAASTGGASSTGGTRATGGSPGAGGTLAVDGATTTGGSKAAGGSSSTGGTPAVVATGGSATTGGGNATTGGAVAALGGNATGGQLVGLGGANATGGALSAGGQAVTTTIATTTPPVTDAGVTNTGATADSGGCGCRVAKDGTRSKTLALLGLIGLLLVRVRRKRTLPKPAFPMV
jgi:alpha-L-fucosidase